jgi:hypothetical protein
MPFETHALDIDARNMQPTVPIPRPGQTLCGWTRATVYKKLAAGDIFAVKDGKRTLIVTSSIVAHLKTLPVASFGANAKPAYEK